MKFHARPEEAFPVNSFLHKDVGVNTLLHTGFIWIYIFLAIFYGNEIDSYLSSGPVMRVFFISTLILSFVALDMIGQKLNPQENKDE